MLAVSAFFELLIYDLLVACGGFPVVRKAVLRTRCPVRKHSPATEEVVNAVDVASCFYFRPVRCLHRSFAAVRLLRRGGIAADLVIATRPVPFLSHAWVEVGNEIVNDLPGYKRKLSVIERI
jgi:hypothetical protein